MVVITYSYEKSDEIVEGSETFDDRKVAMAWLKRQAHRAVERDISLCGVVHGKRTCTFSCQYGKAILAWPNPKSLSGLSSCDLLK